LAAAEEVSAVDTVQRDDELPRLELELEGLVAVVEVEVVGMSRKKEMIEEPAVELAEEGEVGESS